MKLIWRIPPLGLLALFCWTGPLFADYTLLLKNGRRITVKSYREEGEIIKVYRLGGEMSFSRDQIESIIRVEKSEEQRPVLPDLPVRGTQTGAGQSPGKAVGTRPGGEKVAPPGHLVGGEGEEKKEEHVEIKEKAKTPEELRAERRAKEEKEYQKRVREVTGRIKALEDKYVKVIRGGREGGIEAGICIANCGEFSKARAAQLNSRLKDRLHGPARGGAVKLKTRSSFAGQPKILELRASEIKVPPRASRPLPTYTGKEREISQLTKQIEQLRQKREKLIQEMKQKNFDTGSLFLE
jgi:hypothetical protein